MKHCPKNTPKCRYAKGNPKDKARYDPDFPQRVQLSANTVAWPSDRLQAWLDKRIAASCAFSDTSAAGSGGKGGEMNSQAVLLSDPLNFALRFGTRAEIAGVAR